MDRLSPMDISSFMNPADPVNGGSNGQFTGALDDGLNREAFLKMLVAQLSNQDPMNPQDGHEFAAQLAQFSTVEQLQSLNQRSAQQMNLLSGLGETVGTSMESQGEEIASLRNTMEISRATNFIGRTIETKGNTVSWRGEGAAPLTATLAQPAAQAEITVRDAQGTVVRTFTATDLQAGPQAFPWNGLMDNGETAPPGAYTFDVRATDAQGNRVSAEPMTVGTVDRVSFGTDGTKLWIGDVSIPLSDVRSMRS
jgi:flagellar basal-body rod modification protein FlgD